MGEKLSGLNLWGTASQPSNFPASNIHNGTGFHKNQIFTMEPGLQESNILNQISIIKYPHSNIHNGTWSYKIEKYLQLNIHNRTGSHKNLIF